MLWPYVSDRLDIRWLPIGNAPAVWLSPPRVPVGDLPLHQRRHYKPPAPSIFYRLTPIVYAKLVVALDRLIAAKGQNADVREAAASLVKLGDWLVEASGQYTAQDMAAARRMISEGKPPAMAKPEMTFEQLIAVFGA